MEAMDFEQARSAGLSSATFDIDENLKRDDKRQLADSAVDIVQTMNRESMSFDEARLNAVLTEMARWNIDETGMPKDPKAFTFDSIPKPNVLGRQRSSHSSIRSQRATSTASDLEGQITPRKRQLAWSQLILFRNAVLNWSPPPWTIHMLTLTVVGVLFIIGLFFYAPKEVVSRLPGLLEEDRNR
jgi:hypothetical protein